MTIYDTLTSTEAEKMWGLGESAVKKACQRGAFTVDEARKEDTGPRGRWLVTYAGMERVYGPCPTNSKRPGI